MHTALPKRLLAASHRDRPAIQVSSLLREIAALGVWLPASPIGGALGFTALPALYWPILAATLVCYLALTQAVKTLLIRRGWI